MPGREERRGGKGEEKETERGKILQNTYIRNTRP
jgi:hypothetical protein